MDKEWLVENKSEKPIDPTTGSAGFTTVNANGTGPFMLESRQPDVKTVLAANPQWWDKPQHNLDKIVYTPISSDATRVAALLSGEVDFIRNTPLQDVARIEASPGMKVMRAPHLRIIFYGMDMQSETLPGSGVDGNPLRELKVRQAIYQAIDEDGIVRSIMRGNARPAGILGAPQLPFYDASLDVRLPYDPEKSKALLAEAGYPNGFTLPMDCPQGSLINDAEICSAVVGMLGKVGIKVDLTLHTPAQYWSGIPDGKYHFYFSGWAGIPTLDAVNIFSANLATTKGDIGAWNPRGFSDPRVDELILAAWAEYDQGKRQEMLSEIWRIARDQVAKIPLHQQFLVWAMSDKVNAVVPGDEYTRFMYFTKAE
jgi:peptide/nickel transport system substrate-binding protein